jgi:hypothetical protein
MDFNAPRISASSVYKITIESSDRSQVLLDGITFNLNQLGEFADINGDTSDVYSVECANGVCTTDYLRSDYINEIGMGLPVIAQVILEVNSSGTADKKWSYSVVAEGGANDVGYGYIKHFNGTFGIFVITEYPSDLPLSDEGYPIVFSTSGNLPVTVPGEYAGSVTWSYPSESRYTE